MKGAFWGIVLILLGWPLRGLAAEPAAGSVRWTPVLSTGFDTLLHSYPLATSDTTETITEFMVSAGVVGRRVRSTGHRWRLQAEASAGSELYRQQFVGQYSFRDQERMTRLRLDGSFHGRQYRRTTDYALSSDNYEGRLEGRCFPWRGGASTLELRGWRTFLDYADPSTLEVNTREWGSGVFLKNRSWSGNPWRVGYRWAQRSYPDSTGIDRRTHGLEGEFDRHDDQGRGWRVFHKSSRRLIRDTTLRPAAWTHWTDFNGQVGAGRGMIYLELQSEAWRYDQQTSIYFNSWRLQSVLGYRRGGLLQATWRLGLSGERLAADDSPEAYSQLGVRGGWESFGSNPSGSLQVEFGRRHYDQAGSADPLADDFSSYYSDFNYWKIWLMANWEWSRHLSLDLMANYEPESHVEKSDDSSLGFASVRLTWRP